MSSIRLEQVGPAHRAGDQAMVREGQDTEGSYPYNDGELALRDFTALLADLAEERDCRRLPEGVARQITYVVLGPGDEVLGELRFRPWLEDVFANHGHVAYSVWLPCQRRGVAIDAFAEALEIASRDFGLPSVTADVERDKPESAPAL